MPETSAGLALRNHGFAQLLAWAEEGDAKAQHFVALTYLEGTSVPKSFEQAEKWARRAANQGSSASQLLMGIIRNDEAIGGDLLSLERSATRAYMWFTLAAARGNPLAAVERDRIEKAMESQWVSRAQALASTWRPCNDRACWDLEP